MAIVPPKVSKEYIIKIYKEPGHPVAFSSPSAIYRFFNGTVPLSFIKDALEHIDTYTLHKEYKRPSVFNPFYCYERRKKFQADLIDISSLQRDNDAIRFLLLIIDEFSRKVWILSLKSKSAPTTKSALETWCELLEEEEEDWLGKDKRFLSDNGREFINSQVGELMKKKKFAQQSTKNIIHCGIAERANKSIQQLIYRYLTDQGQTRYIDYLPNVLKTYNNRGHRTLNYLSPNSADKKENEDKVREIHSKRYGKVNEKRKKARFSVGDRVRVKTLARGVSSARRSYLQQFHGEQYTVYEVNTRMPIPMYKLRSLDAEDEIQGGFYANELSRVKGDLFKIEKILKTVGKGANKKYLVRWKNFSSKWDSFVNAADIEENTI